MAAGNSPFPTTRHSVIGGCGQGDNRAWETFFSIYGPIIFRFARRAGLSEHGCEEVVANVAFGLMRAFRGGFEVDPAKGRFRDYLRKIVNREIGSLRRHRSGTANHDHSPEPAEVGNTVEQHWCEIEREERLRACLEQLRAESAARPRDWTAFERYVLKSEPAAQVARDLGISTSRLYVIKHDMIQLLKRIRQELDENLGEV